MGGAAEQRRGRRAAGADGSGAVRAPLRLGVLSTARIARRIVAAARASGAVELTALASRDRARGEAYAREHGIAVVHGDYAALLADPDLDAVYVPLPNALHVEWTVAALEAGKHVLCEKPLAPSRAEAERAFAAAGAAGRVLMEAFMYRHHPQVRRLEELLAAGAIGAPRLVQATFTFPVADADAVRTEPQLGGGALLDAGTYGVHAARLLLGEPCELVGRARTGESGVDRSFSALLRFADGAAAHVAASHELPLRQRLEVVGADGAIVLEEPWLIFGAGRMLLSDRGGAVRDVAPAPVDPYLLQLEHFAAVVRGEAEPLLDARDALDQAAALTTLRRSAEEADGRRQCATHMTNIDHA